MYVELNISNNNRLIILYKYIRFRHSKNINNANMKHSLNRHNNQKSTKFIIKNKCN